MSYLPVSEGYAQSTEVQKLARLLEPAAKSADAQAMGHLLAAELWSIDNCDPDGALPAGDGWLLEKAALWRGADGELLEALRTIGFLRRDGETLYFPHWSERQGRVLAERRRWRDSKAAKRGAKGGKAPSSVESTGSPRGVPGGSRAILTDKTDKTELTRRYDIDSDVGLSVAPEEEEELSTGDPVRLLMRMPGWPQPSWQTRALVDELACAHPGVDLAHEVNAWRAHIQENGAPRSYPGAFRGWVKNAKPSPPRPGKGPAHSEFDSIGALIPVADGSDAGDVEIPMEASQWPRL